MIKLTKADVGKKFVCKNGERLTLVSVSSGKRPFCMSDGTHYDSNGRFEAHEFDSQYNIISRVTCGRPKGAKKPKKLSRSEVARLGGKARWARATPGALISLKEGESLEAEEGTYTAMNFDLICTWLIRNGHKEAGIALLTEYRP